MGTTITKAQAAKLYGAALFTVACQRFSMTNLLTGSAPKEVRTGRMQTEKGAPIIRITDLAKQAGDEVEVDVFHMLTGLPTMGDRKLAGRGEDLSKGVDQVSILQGRHMVDPGGRMTQQRTAQDLLKIAKQLLGDDYYMRLEDELMVYHAAGARGDLMVEGTIVPLANHPEFDEITVNPITPPTFDRHFYGGDATSLDTLDSSDIFTLETVDTMALRIGEMENPIMPIQFSADELANEVPFRVLWVSERQWHDFQTSTSGKDWQLLAANASKRAEGFKHPLFRGDCAFWRGILVKKLGKPVQFSANSKVKVCEDDDRATTDIVTAAVRTHRAILMGGQALANAYGKGKSGTHFSMHEEKTDHANSKEVSIAWMNGKKKIRFPNKAGRLNDHGIAVIDTAVSTG